MGETAEVQQRGRQAAAPLPLAGHPEQRPANAVPDAQLAQRKRNADAARQRYNQLQTKLDGSKVDRAALSQTSVSGIRVMDRAEAPAKASSIRKMALQAAGAGIGVAVMILVAGVLILTLVDSTMRRSEDVEQVLEMRPVGTVPRLN